MINGNYALNIFVNYKKFWVAFFLVIALFIIGEIAVGNFLSLSQLFLMVKMSALIALFALCQMAVMCVGGNGLDLSIGFTATITAVFTAGIMDGRNENLLPAIITAIAIGMVIGMVNGALTAYVKLPPLIVTLAMSSILQGIINVYTAGKNITGRPAPVLQLIAAKSTGMMPNIVFLLAVILVVVMVIMNKTGCGRLMFGVGANERAAYLSGINVRLVRFCAFVFSGIWAGLIGLLLLGNMGIAFKDMGSTYVMPSIAAAVVGGVSMGGGEGNYLGVILGSFVLQSLTNLLVGLGWGDAGKWLGFGIVLFIMLVFYTREKRTK
ncbi:MAG: ABC transporter permease [Treponema sp.]|nr:ABC transporter permease [Treponema sp.]